MRLYQKILATGAFIGVVGLTGCDDYYMQPQHKVLKSDGGSAVLSSEPEKSKWSSSIIGTSIYIKPEGKEKRLLFKTKPFLQDIVINDFNKDGIDDFVLYFDTFSKWDGRKTRSVSETYLSTGNDFRYEKVSKN